MKNKEITIYELMGLIKDGKAPKKIKYYDKIYTYIVEEKMYYDEDETSLWKYYNGNILNDAVEILPEENDEQHIEMQFPNTFEEFIKSYSFVDDKEIYTNGSELIPTFRLKQWIDHKKEENDEWEDIEEIDINLGILNMTGTEKHISNHINQLIKNQKYLKEKLESKDE